MPGGFLAEGAPTCEDVPTFGDTVITSRPEPIRHFVTETLGRTATQQDATGVYTGEPRTMIMVALTRRQVGLLRDFLRREDPEAFLTIVNSSEIIGKGFQSI